MSTQMRSVIVLLSATWACQAPASDSAATTDEAPEITVEDKAAIEAAADRFLAAARAADWTQAGNIYADDAISMPANQPAREGRKSIIAMLSSSPQPQNVTFDRLRIEGRGDLAYVYGRYQMTFALPDGQTMTDRGKYMEIWRKQVDGEWRITHDISNSDMPAQPAAAAPATATTTTN